VRRLASILVLCAVGIILLGCSTGSDGDSGIAISDLPASGNAARGEEAFMAAHGGAPSCSSCHTPDSVASPPLTGIGDEAPSRVPGESVREYLFYSIVQPSRFIVESYGDVMYNKYGEALTPQDIADLIAYLLTL
jgi:mono/diheme cytochrome c family protein